MEDDDGACNTGLCLGLGMEGYVPKTEKKKKQRENNQAGCLDLPLELCPKGEEILNTVDEAEEEEEEDDAFFRIKRMDDTTNICRKKLRLTKDQSALLEESFKLHATLNPGQKQSLADQLNLRPRQVEVWFQNRRARTKLKQTEKECEWLRKWCENLREENGRLKKEVEELRALQVGSSPPVLLQLSKTNSATLILCSSCHKPFKPSDANNNNNINTNHKHKLETLPIRCYVG